MASSTCSHFLSSFFFLLLCSSMAAVSIADVPASSTFRHVNEGEIGMYNMEYGGDYRVLSISSGSYPFSLCFFNTTPNAYVLAMRMGANPSESPSRWVWVANRGAPVREKATLTFGRDGNLVLADADGRIAWQTGTANKGVVAIRLLPTGNLVLLDRRGRFVWQSFDHPTDTLLPGQSLRLGGTAQLVSRVSDVDGSLGPYSLVLQASGLAMYMKDPSSPRPLLYQRLVDRITTRPISRVGFAVVPDTEQGFAYELQLEYSTENSSVSEVGSILARPKYNATMSFLRLGSDGNLRVYTLYDKVTWGYWQVTYTLFSRDFSVSECGLPRRCGAYGLCEEDQCVACPSPKGLLGWSRACAPPKRGACGGATSYYKLVGVEHFLNRYSEGEGPVKVEECRERCSKDCSCAGFFYREESSRCLTAPMLGTLTRVSNSSHVAYIKV